MVSAVENVAQHQEDLKNEGNKESSARADVVEVNRELVYSREISEVAMERLEEGVK
jgi:hypothetical protein